MEHQTGRPIRVIITDDHPMMRMGVRSLLATQRTIQIVGEAATAEEAIAIARKVEPDIVIMDISLPEMNGLDGAARLLGDLPGVRVIILSMYEDSEYILRFVRSGASAYVLKNNSPEELLLAIQAVAKGEAYFSPSIAAKILRERQGIAKSDSQDLTDRERAVLIYIAQGLQSKGIAQKLCVSQRTVAKHRENLMAKLGLHSVAELTRYAIAHKLIDIR
jgi:DNA-binding NarL/FixJ family response regulator